jgi:hypothetical protein
MFRAEYKKSTPEGERCIWLINDHMRISLGWN